MITINFTYKGVNVSQVVHQELTQAACENLIKNWLNIIDNQLSSEGQRKVHSENKLA